MGSAGTPNSWPLYDGYKDCSQGICSMYCPQWCYIVFPPPPLGQSDESGTTFSPLIIAIISILVSAFLLVTCYTIATKYCPQRGNRNLNAEWIHPDQIAHNQLPQISSTGLGEAVIKSIAVFQYKKGDGLVEGTECAVCLSEFQEEERLRLLPKCSHAFHLPCIDTWLESHSNCPLCRANVTSVIPLPSPAPNSHNFPILNVDSLEIQLQNDLSLVIGDRATSHQEDEVSSLVREDAPDNCFQASHVLNCETRKNINQLIGQEGIQQFRRSVSVDSFLCQQQGWISETSHVSMKRSISTGRLAFTKHDKGKNSVLPS